MPPNADNPCGQFEQNNLAFYQALLADSRESWECLYLKSYRVFIPYACQRSAISTDDALDILQDGLAEFAVNLKSGRYAFQGKPVTAYVFTVCRNRWVTFLRKNPMQKIEAATELSADDDPFFSASETLPHPAFLANENEGEREDIIETNAVANDPIWEDNEVDWEAVSRSFSESGADCQAMLHCFYVEEKSLGECGARIGLQENSAKVKRFRCAQRMKSLYSQYKRA